MLQNLGVNFIFHVFTIKLIMRVQEKTELSAMAQRSRVELNQNFTRLSNSKNCKIFPGTANSWHPFA